MLNPGAWTHYAWAMRDALEIAALPAVEVHLSDPLAREPWRHLSVVEDLCFESVRGRGPEGYLDALALLREHLEAAAAMSPPAAARAMARAPRAPRSGSASASSTRCSSTAPVDLRYVSGYTGSNGLALLAAERGRRGCATAHRCSSPTSATSRSPPPRSRPSFERAIVTGELRDAVPRAARRRAAAGSASTRRSSA